MFDLKRHSELTARQIGLILALIFLIGVGLRFWQLGDAPPGLYRDEAYNGLDALGVINGEHALFFEANNGREPAYIYLTALSVRFFDRTPFAVRLPAAVVGSLTTLLVFGLGRSWFNAETGLLAAFLWATTVWSVHLSRIGLRVVLVVPLLTAAAWLATIAYRQSDPKQARGWWFAAGLVYGLSFYTYLASRLTPAAVVALVVLWLILAPGPFFKRIFPQSLWAALGILLPLLPWIWLFFNAPEQLLGRTEQVSIFNPEINKGDFWGTLWHHTGHALGMFFWQGDTIIRHNPPGRPVFDVVMGLFFILGLVILLRNWRKKAAQATLAWSAIMLASTIFAEDAPHFLRSVGLMPMLLLIPAVGLSQSATWPKLVRLYRQGLVILLCLGSVSITVYDYFTIYNQSADTAYLFEAAARTLAETAESDTRNGRVVYLDQRYSEGWSSIPFLFPSENRNHRFDPVAGISFTEASDVESPTVIYAWPFDSAELAGLVGAFPAGTTWSLETGPMARGDLEPTPYPLYLRMIQPPDQPLIDSPQIDAQWVGESVPTVQLHAAEVDNPAENRLNVTLKWSLPHAHPTEPLTVFVHILDTETGLLTGQDDRAPLEGWIPMTAWPIGVHFIDNHRIDLTRPFDPDRDQIWVGFYPNGRPEARISVVNRENLEEGTAWQIQP